MNTATCIVRITNERTGKFEVETSSDSNVIKVTSVGTSLYLVGKDLQSTWLVEIRVTGKGSLKIDNIIQRFDMSQNQHIDTSSSIVPSAPLLDDDTNAMSIPTPQSAPTSSHSPIEDNSPITSVSPIVSVPMPLTKDVETWRGNEYYVSPDIRLAFQTSYKMLQRKPQRSIKILITGASGLGKTTVVQDFARWSGLDCLRVNCGAISDPTEWFFDREVIEQNGASVTRFVPSEFANMIQKGNCVIILDEFNRLSPYMHNALFPLLDDDGQTTLHHHTYKVGANVIFVATVNLGYKYTGTDQLDEALINRFRFILEVKPLPFDIEVSLLELKENISHEDAETIVSLAQKIRENKFGISCSTRDTLAIASMVACDMSIRDAFEYSIILRIQATDESGVLLRKTVLDLVNAEIDVRNAPKIAQQLVDDMTGSNVNAINATI